MSTIYSSPEAIAQKGFRPERRIQVYVWQLPLRFAHWFLVLSIITLSLTGWYIHSPFVTSTSQTAYLMANIRFIHLVAGFVFLGCLIIRLYYFLAGNRWEHWRAYVPVKKWQFQEMWQTAQFYGFLRPYPVPKIGHNAMAAASYVMLWSAVFLEAVTGLVMFNWMRHGPILGFLVGWIPGFIDIQYIRLIHFFLMFFFIAFAILHVHLCMLIGREEKNGLIDSMFSGYKVITVHGTELDMARDLKSGELVKLDHLPDEVAQAEANKMNPPVPSGTLPFVKGQGH